MYRNFATETERKKAEVIADSPPISFLYGGKPFPEGFRQTSQHTYLHEETGLLVSLEVSLFGEDSSAVEWTLNFENTGSKDTPILEQICTLDLSVDGSQSGWVGEIGGVHAKANDFSYSESPLSNRRWESNGSRHQVPFFNFAPEGINGWIIGLGWTGMWYVEAEQEEGSQLRVKAGMQNTHFLLHPGEKVRQPRVLLLFWEGDRLRGQNMCRRHLVLHHIPKDESGEPFPPICPITWGGMKAQHHLDYIRFIRENRLRFDCYWIDAGWFGPDHETEEFQNFYTEDWAYNQGEWRVNRFVYPNGLREVADAANAAGMKFLLWVGSYAANWGYGWTKEHPEWASPLPDPHRIGLNQKPAQLVQLNVSVPEARKWIMDTLLTLFETNHVEGYREDCRIPYAGEDTPDRIGISEITSVTALYEIWDALREACPTLVIDNCGGGGSRIDLETLSRSYVLWRSDYNCTPDVDCLGSQVGNWGLGHFIPLVNGAAPIVPGSDYRFRSSLYGGMPFGMYHPCGYGSAPIAPPEDYPVEWHRNCLDQYQHVKPLFSGDFFPLTGCDTETDSICSYAFWREDLKKGCLFAFFRQDCPESSLSVILPLPKGKYRLSDWDSEREFILTAEEEGLSFNVETKEKPFAAVWDIEKLDETEGDRK
ncbi:MAG: alpha-galactosidase [Clostridia bacterium]|nr:alpha-galactosidase [Clostridia bacterium]